MGAAEATPRLYLATSSALRRLLANSGRIPAAARDATSGASYLAASAAS